jgi:hypothetical protein
VSGRVVGLAPLSCFFGSSSPFVLFSFAPLILLVEVVALIIFADSKNKNKINKWPISFFGNSN